MPRYQQGKKKATFRLRGNEFSRVGKHELPDSTVEYLRHGVRTHRNNALRDAAHQCRDSGRTSGEWRDLLGARARQDGLPENEVEKTLNSCLKPSEAREPCGPKHRGPSTRKGIMRREKPDIGIPTSGNLVTGIPETEHEQTLAWLRAAFESGEHIGVSPGDEDHQPGKGVTFEREELIAKLRAKKEAGKAGVLSDIWTTKKGLFVRLNPVTDGGSLNKDVTDLRHILVDIDDQTIPRETQLKTFQDSGLPITCIVDSTVKGLHAWVRVDAETVEQYRERYETVLKSLDGHGVDPGVGNPNRYGRAVGGFRGKLKPFLVSLAIGLPCWADWEAENDPAIERNLATGRNPIELSELEIDESATLLGQRFLCRGGGMMWTGTTGIGKSSSGVQQDLLWSIGAPAFGIEPNGELKIATLQIENDEGDLIEMSRGSLEAMELTDTQKKIVTQNVKTFTVDVFGESILALATKLAEGWKGWKPDIIRLDPFQALSGLDVAGDVAGVLDYTFRITRIAQENGIGVILCHHTPKINIKSLEEKGLSYSSYLGAGGAQLANWARADMLLLPTEVEGIFQLIAGKRSSRLGWPGKRRYFKHATKGIAWLDCSPEEVKSVEDAREGNKAASKRGGVKIKGASSYKISKEKGEKAFKERVLEWHKEKGEWPSKREAMQFGIANQPRKNGTVLAILRELKEDHEKGESGSEEDMFKKPF